MVGVVRVGRNNHVPILTHPNNNNSTFLTCSIWISTQVFEMILNPAMELENVVVSTT